MNRKALAVSLIALFVAGVLLSAPAAAEEADKPGGKKPAPKPKVAKLGQPVPDVVLCDANGKAHSLAGYRSKIVVLEWMNPDCPYSKRQYTRGITQGLAAKYAPKGVVWLAVNSTHYWTPEKSKAFAAKNKVTYPILDDLTGRVGRIFTAKTTPDIRVIDKTGKLVYTGAIDDDAGGRKASPTNHVAQALDALLADKPLPTSETRPYGCSVKYAKTVKLAKAGPAEVGKTAPDFTLKDHEGRTVHLSDYAGRITVLEWVNPDCPYSKRQYTRGVTKALAAKYGAKGVAWIAVNTTHYWNQAKNQDWVAKNKLPYPILDDSPGDVGHLYDAKTSPDMRIIDKTGKLVYSGAIDDDPNGRSKSPVNYVAKALDELLAGKTVSDAQTRPYGCSVKYAKK
jgi:peroxiredoxin